jgi:HEAT repeat protein
LSAFSAELIELFETKIAPRLLELLNIPPESARIKEILTDLRPFAVSLPKRLEWAFNDLFQSSQDAFNPRKANIALILRIMKYYPAYEPIKKILEDSAENRMVRVAAAEAIADLHGPEAGEILLSHLIDSNEDRRVRAACAVALGWFQYPPARDRIIELLYNELSEIWVAAADALAFYVDESITDLLLDRYESHIRTNQTNNKMRVREALLKRNLIPCIATATPEKRNNIRELILDQEVINIQGLEKLHDQFTDPVLRDYLEEILQQIQPKLRTRQGDTILL